MDLRGQVAYGVGDRNLAAKASRIGIEREQRVAVARSIPQKMGRKEDKKGKLR